MISSGLSAWPKKSVGRPKYFGLKRRWLAVVGRVLQRLVGLGVTTCYRHQGGV